MYHEGMPLAAIVLLIALAAALVIFGVRRLARWHAARWVRRVPCALERGRLILLDARKRKTDPRDAFQRVRVSCAADLHAFYGRRVAELSDAEVALWVGMGLRLPVA